VAWIHIDRKMILAVHKHVIARIPRFSMAHDGQKTWLLNINGVRASDKGIYMCQVNTDPMISQIGYLQVVGELYLLSIVAYEYRWVIILYSSRNHGAIMIILLSVWAGKISKTNKLIFCFNINIEVPFCICGDHWLHLKNSSSSYRNS